MAVALLLPLAACANNNSQLVTSSTTETVASDTAFAIPAPGGPAITAVLEKRYANATQQEILLATQARTPGQNMLRVQVFGPVDQKAASRQALRPGFLPVTNATSEMRKLLPGVPMQQSPYYVQNKYGPFGYAVGRTTSGDRCLYGWQRVTSTGTTQTWIGNKGSIQIRLRLCQAGASEEQLLQSMYGFTITSFFKDRNWNPYGEPAATDESLGRPGEPIYPLSSLRFETVSGDGATALPERSAPPPRRVARAPEPIKAPALPEPVGPPVPLPPQTGEGASVLVPPPPAANDAAQ